MELGRSLNPFGQWRIKPVQAIQEQNLIPLNLNCFARNAAALFEIENRLLDSAAIQQDPEMLIEQLDIHRFGGLVISIIDPIGRMFGYGPKVVIQVEHYKVQTLALKAIDQLERRRAFT